MANCYRFFLRHALAIAFLLSSLCFPAQGEIIDRVVAIVNEEVITLSELLQIVQTQSQNAAAVLSPENYRGLLQQIIDQKLVDQEALKEEIAVSDREVDRAIETIKEKNGLTDEQFNQALAQQGMTRGEYREKMREEIRRSQVIAQKIQSQVSVGEKEVKKYFNEHRDDYFESARVKIEQIFIPLGPEATADTRATYARKAEDALNRIRSGDDFRKVAEEYGNLAQEKSSDDVGYFNKGELMTPLDDAAFSLKVGAVSNVISTNKGFFIIRVLDRTEEKTKTLEEVRDQISNQLVQQKMEKKFQDWIKDLHSNAYIEIKI